MIKAIRKKETQLQFCLYPLPSASLCSFVSLVGPAVINCSEIVSVKQPLQFHKIYNLHYYKTNGLSEVFATMDRQDNINVKAFSLK